MTFLWHDYETFGTNPALDRPAQFAAIRSDENLQELSDPLVWYCRPANDMLPHPRACLVTGITPQEAHARGRVETEFAAAIHAEMMQPGTCVAGYNNLRFDDEFTRNILYRNFRDPYEREWRNGNSRFDLIDLARMCFALRPDGIEWPEREPGVPSFKLEDLTGANDIAHEGAHDALVDVRATIALARILRDKQPKLFQWALGLRQQTAAMQLLNTAEAAPLVHTTSRIPAVRGCTTLVLPIAVMPDRPKSVIAYDLMTDPGPLLSLAADEIADRVFTAAIDLPEGVERIPLKAIHSNKVPMLAPASVLTGMDPARIGLDPDLCRRHAAMLLEQMGEIRGKVMQVFTRMPPEGDGDPDTMIYSGGFFSRRDRAAMNQVLATEPEELGSAKFRFEDARLPEMLFRYRARNFPDTLDNEDWARWEADRRQRLLEPGVAGQMGLEDFRMELLEARQASVENGAAQRILDEIEAWVVDLGLEKTP